MSEAIQQLMGTVLDDKYLLQSILGVGGMGAVFKGVQLTVERPVAVKLLRPNALLNADTTMAKQLRDRFKREATLTAMLRHPNNIHLIDFGTTPDGTLYLVLEFLEGQELSKAMTLADGPMDPTRVAAIGQHICLALAEAHALDLIHRDLKPDNIFLTDFHGATEHVKVMDYGIARLATEEELNLTATGLIIGTPKYMSPEQVEAKPLTPQSDLYSLGVLLYEMLMGQALFQAESVMSLAFKHVHDTPPPLDIRYGAQWVSLLDMMLAKDPAQRPASAGEVASRLQALSVDDSASHTILPTSLPTHGLVKRSPKKKRPTKLLAVGILAAVVIGIVAVLATGGGNDPPASESTELAAKEQQVPTAVTPPPKPKPRKPPATAPKPVTRKPPKPPAPKAAASKPAVAKPTKDVAKPEPPKPTKLSLLTTPSGATVLRQGKVVCTTPCKSEPLHGVGETALVIRLAGHKERTVTIPLKPSSVVDRVFVLAAIAVPKPPPVVPAGVAKAAPKTTTTTPKKPKKLKKAKKRKKSKPAFKFEP